MTLITYAPYNCDEEANALTGCEELIAYARVAIDQESV